MKRFSAIKRFSSTAEALTNLSGKPHQPSVKGGGWPRGEMESFNKANNLTHQRQHLGSHYGPRCYGNLPYCYAHFVQECLAKTLYVNIPMSPLTVISDDSLVSLGKNVPN